MIRFGIRQERGDEGTHGGALVVDTVRGRTTRSAVNGGGLTAGLLSTPALGSEGGRSLPLCRDQRLGGSHTGRQQTNGALACVVLDQPAFVQLLQHVLAERRQTRVLQPPE